MRSVTDKQVSVYQPPDDFTLHEDVSTLPELRGYGIVAPLWVAMTRDAELRQLVRDLTTNSDALSISDFRARVETIVLDWTGADTVDSHSRGPNMDARHLAAMEALAGSGFRQFGRIDPGPTAGAALEAEFQSVIDTATVRLLAQSAVSSFLIDARQSPTTANVLNVYTHAFAGVGTLRYDPLTNKLTGDLDTILGFYVRSHAEGSTPPLGIDDTIALLHMLRLDFGSDGTAYRAAVEAAFVAAGFEEAVASGYADRAVETRCASSTVPTATTRSGASTWTTRSGAAAGRTRSTASEATTRWRVGRGTTRSTAATKTTRWRAGRTMTRFTAGTKTTG